MRLRPFRSEDSSAKNAMRGIQLNERGVPLVVIGEMIKLLLLQKYW